MEKPDDLLGQAGRALLDQAFKLGKFRDLECGKNAEVFGGLRSSKKL
jgi:hypothetical protein